MTRAMTFGLAAVIAVTTGCALDSKPKPTPSAVQVVTSKADAWLGIASAADRDRLNRVASAWSDGLAQAKSAGSGAAIVEEGALLKPFGGLRRPAPTPGSYRCRLITLGRDGTRGSRFERFKPFFCYVEIEGDLFTIVKQTGSQRPAGRLWEDDNPTRLIFLGSLALGNEEEARAYGDDPKRDMAGIFERVGPFRWRLAIPYPKDGAKIDVFELTPVADQPAT